MSGENSEARSAFGEETPRKPASSLGYWLTAMVAFAAVAGAIGWFVVGLTGLGDKVAELDRIVVPGQKVVQFDAGDKAMYWEAGDPIPPLDIAVREVDGPPVEVGPHGGEVTYDVESFSGTAIAGFEIPRDGRYLVVVGGAERGVVAFGDGVGGRIVSAVVGGLGIFFGGLLLSGAVIIMTARRRRP